MQPFLWAAPPPPCPKCSQETIPDLSRLSWDPQISLTGRPHPACHGGTLGWSSTAHLPGTLPDTSSSAGTSPRCSPPPVGAGGWERGRGSAPPPTHSTIPPPQTTKAKYKTPMYPYLLPKSTSTANQLPFMLPGMQCATVQVRLPTSACHLPTSFSHHLSPLSLT